MSDTALAYGTVTGRFVVAGSNAGAADPAPEEVPLGGTVTLTPVVSVVRTPNSTPPRITAIQAVTCPVVSGELCAPNSTTPGVRIAATEQVSADPSEVRWTATFQLTGADWYPAPATFTLPAGGEVDLASVIPVEG